MKKRIAILCIIIALCSMGMVMPVVAAGKIAFESNRDENYEIYIMNADGTRQTRLTSNLADDIQPALSPDGEKILFVSNRDENLNIFVMNADGTGLHRLTSNKAKDSRPAWSPNGKKIAFESNRDGNDEIYVMNADGTRQTRITNNPASDIEPAWSPDGKKIAFSSDRSEIFYQIHVMKADGTGVTQLTFNPPDTTDFPDLLQDMNNWHPDWSPDGTKIVFASDHLSASYIYVMNADGSGQTEIPHTDHGYGPAWSPDSSKIAFYSDWDGVYNQIFVINPDGTARTAITSTFAENENPSWSKGVLSPVLVRVRILPDPLNIATKGYFAAFITLPGSYKAADVDSKSVVCEGAPAVRIVRMKMFPQTFAAVFSREQLVNVKPGKAVPFTVSGTINDNGEIVAFRGSTSINVISKSQKTKEAINNMITLADNRVFDLFYSR
ncbi:MAG: hypothetical protein M0Q91_10625 [Methanoregula sp.]|jgi:TolB protein|nr:hypothetical protein [Methanoregula sp.]